MELYKYTSWRPYDGDNKRIENYYVRDNLINHKLYFNSATSFNDPFDLYPALETEYTARDLITRAINIVRENEGLRYRDAASRAKQLIKERNLRGAGGRKAAIERARDLLRRQGVCCFTKNGPETLLMWAHYGDQHSGICLCFDMPRGLEYLPPPENLAGPNPITYSKDFPRINLFKDPSDYWVDCMMTKSTEWAYEQEYRALASSYIGPVQYKPTLLKAVIAGCKMGFKELIDLKNTISAMNPVPKLYKAERKKDQFGLDIDPIQLVK